LTSKKSEEDLRSEREKRTKEPKGRFVIELDPGVVFAGEIKAITEKRGGGPFCFASKRAVEALYALEGYLRKKKRRIQQGPISS